MQRFPVPEGEHRAGPTTEKMGPEVRVPPPQPQHEPRAVAPGLKLTSERFMKRNPPIFEGAVDPAVAEEWVSMIEKIFEFVQIEDEEKVKCVVYMLRKDARIWWEAVAKSRDVAVMTWAEFLREFNFKYYSQAVINIKVAEFTTLQQGNLSVIEYVRQFDQLSRYAPDMIQTETSKVWRFLSGLRPGLAGLVDTGRDGPESYADAVRRAIRQESWAKTDKGLSLGTGGGQKEVLQPSPLQIVGNQRSGGRFGF